MVRPPKQTRSKATLHRILETTKALVRESSIADLRVAEIARKAHCSVGSFYARFTDKNALVLALHRELVEELEHCINEYLSPEFSGEKHLADLVNQYGQNVKNTLFRYRGLLRTVEAEIENGGDVRYIERERLLESKATSSLHKLLVSRFPDVPSWRLEVLAKLGITTILSLTRHSGFGGGNSGNMLAEASHMFATSVQVEAREKKTP